MSDADKVETPPELRPKIGRPPGAKNKPRPEGEISVEALKSAWHGLWLLSKVLTFVLAGAEAAPVARLARATYRLEDLPDDEARQDAKDLLPLFRDWPLLARVLTWVGAPVLLARRVHAHLVRTPFPKRAPATTPPGPAALPVTDPPTASAE